jgi:methyltransferase family protein
VLLIRGQSTGADRAGLPLPDGCMDLIVSTASLHHWTDASAVIVFPDRALRPQWPDLGLRIRSARPATAPPPGVLAGWIRTT